MNIRHRFCFCVAKYWSFWQLQVCEDQKKRDFIYDLQNFLLRPEVFHNTIRGSYCISSGRNQIVLQILTSQTDHTPIRTHTIWYLLIMELAVSCPDFK
jgi:hypothetical protein